MENIPNYVKIFLKIDIKKKNVLLTTSCTDALEMCAILANIEIDDKLSFLVTLCINRISLY